MSHEMVISISRKRDLYTVLIVCWSLLLLALLSVLLVSIFQATTQIQEQTLAFVPKIVAVLVGLFFWSVDAESNDFICDEIFSNLTRFVG